MLLLAAASGLRQGEIFGLEVGHIDFNNGTVRVQQQVISPDRGAPCMGTPKTHQSYRTVPVARSAMDVLTAQLLAYPVVGVKTEDRTDPNRVKWRSAQLVFAGERREAIRRATWSEVWENLEVVVGKALAKQHAEPTLLTVPDGSSMRGLRLWPDEEGTTRAAIESVLSAVPSMCPLAA